MVGNLQLVFLQLSVHPAILLFLDEQSDDVPVVEAKECGIVAGHVGEDGPDSGLFAEVETRRLRHWAGQVKLSDAALVWGTESGSPRERLHIY